MPVVVVDAPDSFVSLELAKKHMRVDFAEDDDLIQMAVDTACQSIDGPAGWLGRAIGEQTLELRLDGFYEGDWALGGGSAWDGCWSDWTRWPFASRIRLPYPPFVSVTSITYEDASGDDHVLTPTGWKLADGSVAPSFGMSWPSGRMSADAVRIRYVAGYPDTQDGASTVPGPLRSAALLMAADLYANREGQQIDQSRGVAVENPTLMNLLGFYRVYR